MAASAGHVQVQKMPPGFGQRGAETCSGSEDLRGTARVGEGVLRAGPQSLAPGHFLAPRLANAAGRRAEGAAPNQPRLF